MSNRTSDQNPQMRLFFSGDEYFQAALRDIRGAEKKIWIESYIYDMDPIGLKFLEALHQAHERGVEVRLIVDGVGSFNWMSQLIKACHQKKIPLRIYHPVPFQLKLFQRLSWRRVRHLLFLFRRMNKRNHRKIILIDREIVYLGSFNISQVHSEKYMAERAWRDSGVRAEVSPRDVSILEQASLHVWRMARHRVTTNLKSFLRPKLESRKKTVMSLFRLNSRLDARFFLLRDLQKRMKAAESRILLTNAYFIPRARILRALRRAARRGVYVALCLPDKTDVWFVREASRSLYQRLLKDGVHIFEYQPRVLHAKTLIIDDWATVGSHNMNHRSFIHDLEAEMVITEPKLVQQLVHQWQDDIRQSRPITLQDLGNFPWWRRVFCRILYWFRYWI